MLNVALAEKLIEQITQYTDYNVNIMDTDGIIIASRDPSRIGTYHEAAWQVLNGKDPLITVNSDGDYPGAGRGINMAIEIDGRREGVVGITGDPKELRPIALIIKMAIETMIRYENQQLRVLHRQTNEERLLEMLMAEEPPAPEKIRPLLRKLGYRADVPRAAILCRTCDSAGPAVLISAVKSCPLHQGEDIVLQGPESVLILKSIPPVIYQDFLSAAKDCRALMEEYLQQLVSRLPEDGRNMTFYAGTLQDNPSQYHASCAHCRWLERNAGRTGNIVWFYDHFSEYIAHCLPPRNLRQIYGIYADHISGPLRRRCLEIIGSLIASDFNIAEAARISYMHKNTFTYQYNKLRDRLGVNPQDNPQDKWFMVFFYYYLRNHTGKAPSGQTDGSPQ